MKTQRMQKSYHPTKAYRYFPQGNQLILGEGKLAWRKIFETIEKYMPYEQQKLINLQKDIQEQKVKIHPWFDRANLLRYLQAHKFDRKETLDAILKYSKWRQEYLPLPKNPQIQQLLNRGIIYVAGRDKYFRPILIFNLKRVNLEADLNKMDLIPLALVTIMEFFIEQVFLPGQVQNYILIMNLQGFALNLLTILKDVLDFAKNAYRGRLFVSYILNMPSHLKWAWNGFISNLVSENTLKKLKVSGKGYSEEMWEHIDPNLMEKQYRGKAEQISQPFWPVPLERLKYQQNCTEQICKQQEYRFYYQQGLLKGKTIMEELVRKEEGTKQQIQASFQTKIEQEVKFRREIASVQTFFSSEQFQSIC